MAYQSALEDHLESIFRIQFEVQIETGENIINNLILLAQYEPNSEAKGYQYILGMFLELLGMDIQLNSENKEKNIFN